jgi:hypothetical protein
MKILIAGDSFASPYWNGRSSGRQNSDHLPPETSWSRLLEKTYNWQVTNIAVTGASLEHCYFALKKSDLASYNKIIVVVTNPGRVPFNDNNPIQLHLPGSATAEQYISKYPNLPSIEKEYALAVKSYYEHIYNPTLSLIYFEAVLKKIIELVPLDKLILINGCCSNSQLQHYFHYPVMLQDVVKQESANLNIKFQELQLNFAETDLHINHLTLENKAILSKVVYDLCTTGSSDVTLDDFKKMNPDDFSLNYQLRNLTNC